MSEPWEKLALAEADLVEARKDVETDPSEGQKESGNYAKGHVRWQGLELTIENPKGSTRSGTDRDGRTWTQKMHHDYGYFRGSEGKDGDHVDVFIGPDLDSELVFVVNQVRGDTFDEHKVVIGTTHEEQARDVYLSNYEDGWQGLGSIKPKTLPEFKTWIRDRRATRKEANATCPGCGEPFADDEPYPDVEQCEVCERFGAPKEADDDSGNVGTSEHVPTLAVDLDGTLAQHYDDFDPDHIPDPKLGAKKWLTKFKDAGVRIIVHTVRGNDELTKEWLDEHGIPYDYVNENPDQPEDSSDKVYADVYWDDRAISAKGQLVKSVNDVAGELGIKLAGDAVIYDDPEEALAFLLLEE